MSYVYRNEFALKTEIRACMREFVHDEFDKQAKARRVVILLPKKVNPFSDNLDVILTTFSFLNLKEMSIVSRVSRTWKEVCDSPYFWMNSVRLLSIASNKTLSKHDERIVFSRSTALAKNHITARDLSNRLDRVQTKHFRLRNILNESYENAVFAAILSVIFPIMRG